MASLHLLASAVVAVLAASASSPLPRTTATFRTPAVTLSPGQIANTNGDEFVIPWPQEKIAIRSFHGKVVDDQGDLVPLTDLYVHHWLIFANFGKFHFGWCTLDEVWGIGAEMYGLQYDYPEPYAVVMDGDETWSANLHFLRTDTVPQDNMQKAIECHCADGTPTNPHGSISCCQDGEFVWGMPNSTSDPRSYYLEYTIEYSNVTEDVIPLTMYSFDAAAEHSSDCRIEYQISETVLDEHGYALLENDTVIPQDIDVVFVELHQHIGALNYTLEHFDSEGKFVDTLCVGLPTYGNGTEPGNEDGYVVAISSCKFDDGPYKLKKNDVVKMKSYYTGRTIAGGGNYHEGVMGLWFLAGARVGPSDCETRFKTICGNPLPANSTECLACSSEHEAALVAGGCYRKEAQYSWQQVRFLCITDNGVKSPYPLH